MIATTQCVFHFKHRKVAMWNGVLIASALAVLSTAAFAQTDATLPSKLSGRMTATGATRTFILDIAMVFDGDRKPGAIAGHVTHHGVSCGAENEPLAGTWDGTELRVVAALHANVNTLRMGGQCDGAKVTYTLKRKPGGGEFEGDVRANTSSAVATIVLSP
jgi:hypothetical protein